MRYTIKGPILEKLISFIFNQIISRTYGVDTIRLRNHLVASGFLVFPAGTEEVPWHGKEVVVDETAIEREETHQKQKETNVQEVVDTSLHFTESRIIHAKVDCYVKKNR